MPEYTITYVDVVQETIEAESMEEAIEAFLHTEEGGDQVLDLTRNGLRAKEGPSEGDDWIGLAGDMEMSTPYEITECEHGEHAIDGVCYHHAESATCKHCERHIIRYSREHSWIDPEATGDDSIWRESCGDSQAAYPEHEPKEDDD